MITKKQKEIIKQLHNICHKSNCHNESMNMNDIVKNIDELIFLLNECKKNGINDVFMNENHDKIWNIIIE